MIIPPRPAGVSATQALAEPPAPNVKPAVKDMLRSMAVVDRLTQMQDTGTTSIDQALDSFWDGMIDDCAYRTGAELARHNYHRDLGRVESKGGQLMRQVEQMPAGPQRTQAREKLENFLAEQRAQIEAHYRNDPSNQPHRPQPFPPHVQIPRL